MEISLSTLIIKVAYASESLSNDAMLASLFGLLYLIGMVRSRARGMRLRIAYLSHDIYLLSYFLCSNLPLPLSVPSLAVRPLATKTHLSPFPGTPPLPTKVIEKILSHEYIELADLLPEQLHLSTTSIYNSLVILPESAYSTQRRKRRQIPDIGTWVQVYSVYMLVLATFVPNKLPELIAYQLLIYIPTQ